MYLKSSRSTLLALPLATIVWLLLIGSLPTHWPPSGAILNATNALHDQTPHPSEKVEGYLENLEDIKESHPYKSVISIAGPDEKLPSVEIIPEGKATETDELTPSGAVHPSQPEPTLIAKEISEKVNRYVQSILNPADKSVERMQCPLHLGSRYESLKDVPNHGKVKYFIALDLFQVEALLPRLMGTVIETIEYLGPENCAVSVVEGRSTDLTYNILSALKTEVELLGSRFYLQQSDINPLGGDLNRIEALAVLRNLALAPLNDPRLFDSDTIIVFSNDIASCPEDILELLYQHKYQDATMTCSMDWIHDGATFYDVWVSRAINGDTFFEVPQDATWAYRDNLFWNDAASRRKFDQLQPFQVYACWGGMVTMDAAPFIDGSLRFRQTGAEECFMGEPTTLAKDLWGLGRGRILTVPSVAVGYSDNEGAKIKKLRGYVSDHLDLGLPSEQRQAEKVEWAGPPGMLKCAPEWQRQSWIPPL